MLIDSVERLPGPEIFTVTRHKHAKMKKWLARLLPLVIGAAGGVLLAKTGIFDSLDAYPKRFGWYIILLMPVLYIFVIGVHELGHVFMGLRQNFQFYGLTVGPLSWKRGPDDKLRFSWNTQLNVAGGVAYMLPHGPQGLARRFSWYAAGGPLASVVLALAAYLLARWLPEGSLPEMIMGATCAFSGLIALITLIPMRSGGFSSDGMRILTFSRDTPLARAELLVLQIVSQLRIGIPYAEYPVAELQELAAHPEVPLQQRLNLRFYEYLHQLHTGQLTLAEPLLREVIDNLEAYPKGIREIFFLEQAIFYAIYREDLPAARAALDRYKPSPLAETAYVNLARAGVARLAGEREDWRIAMEASEKALPAYSDQSRAGVIRQLIKTWREELQSDGTPA